MTFNRFLMRNLPLCVVLGLLVLLISSAVMMNWPSRGVRNQRKILRLLWSARPERARNGTIATIVSGDDLTLISDRERIVDGYVVIGRIKLYSFTIEAKPVKAGETGGFSFFRDEAGVVRFEPETSKPADSKSRPWSTLSEK